MLIFFIHAQPVEKRYRIGYFVFFFSLFHLLILCCPTIHFYTGEYFLPICKFNFDCIFAFFFEWLLMLGLMDFVCVCVHTRLYKCIFKRLWALYVLLILHSIQLKIASWMARAISINLQIDFSNPCFVYAISYDWNCNLLLNRLRFIASMFFLFNSQHVFSAHDS